MAYPAKKISSPTIYHQVSTLTEGDAEDEKESTRQQEKSPADLGSSDEEEETSQTPEPQNLLEETVSFKMKMSLGRPHFQVTLGKGSSKISILQDSGSKFNILSKNLLLQSDKEGGYQYQLKTPSIRLASHTGSEIQILGEAMIPINMKDLRGAIWTFELVILQITDDINKAILGTSFITPRASTI